METAWTKDSIRTLLLGSDLAVERAVVALYDRQTQDEKAVGETVHHNR